MNPYYARLAGIAMSVHGLNRDNWQQLARWAEYAAAHRLTNRGVLITGDGRLHAETVLPPPPPPDHMGGRSALPPPNPPWQIVAATWRGPGEAPTPPRALATAWDRIRDTTGLPTAHILYHEVCTGWAGSDVEQNPSP